MKNIFISFILIVFCLGCQSKKSIVLPFEGSKLFIDGVLNDDGTAEILISRTYPPTGSFKEDTSYFKNISGEIYENNIAVASIKQKSRNTFVLDKKIDVNFSSAYAIKVRAKDFPEVISDNVYFTKKIDLTSFDYRGYSKSLLSPTIKLRNLKLSFMDKDPKTNYYEIEVHFFDEENQRLFGTLENTVENPFLENSCTIAFGGKVLTKDICTLGNIKNVNLGFDEMINVRFEVKYVKKIKLVLRNISYEQYEFITGEGGGDNLEQAFSSKPPRYSNVKNGYGAFFANTIIEKEVEF